MKKQLTLFGLCATLIMAIGCQSTMPQRDQLEAAGHEVPIYTLDAGDKVRVTVYGHEDLSGFFSVDDTGVVSLPLVQRVTAKGLSLPDFEQEVVKLLSRQHIINPKVSIELTETRPFCVLGEVRRPGCFNYEFGMTADKAIARAGGYTYRARRNELIITRDGGKQFAADHSTPVNVGDVIEVYERMF